MWSLLGLPLFACSVLATSSITWLRFQHSAVIKLDTPGYPFWVMDKANAPMLYAQAEKYYWGTETPSALLFNLTLSADNKTLFLNHEKILPLEDIHTPPRLNAYQIPAAFTEARIKSLVGMGLLNREWEPMTLAWRFLQLDYDRVVWSDPDNGPYINNVPVLRFRIMGLGAHGRSDVLDAPRQQVLHVTLADRNHGSSDAAESSYGITDVRFTDVEDELQRYVPSLEPEQPACGPWSWRCPDVGLYENGAAPYYRFIWRSRFDEFGRVGSLRHAVHRKGARLAEFWEDGGLYAVKVWAVMTAVSVVIVLGIHLWKKQLAARREGLVRTLAESDALLQEDAGEAYVDEEKEEMSPRPQAQVLIDVEAAEA